MGKCTSYTWTKTACGECFECKANSRSNEYEHREHMLQQQDEILLSLLYNPLVPCGYCDATLCEMCNYTGFRLKPKLAALKELLEKYS